MKFTFKQLILAVAFIALLLGVAVTAGKLWQKSNEVERMRIMLQQFELDTQNVRSSATSIVYKYRILSSGKMKTVLITDADSIQRIVDALENAPRDQEAEKWEYKTSTNHVVTFFDEQNAGMDQVRIRGDHLLEYGGRRYKGGILTNLLAEFQAPNDEERK